jgi:sugar transferase (PEP-CTERM/EpsH1 system associated)
MSGTATHDPGVDEAALSRAAQPGARASDDPAITDVLYLVHRIPYPPNKGDKLRSYRLLKHLAKRHRVHLGTFVDDPEDLRHVDAHRPFCASLHVARLDPRIARVRSLVGLAAREPLTLAYYRDAGLHRFVADTVRTRRVDTAVVFCAAMAQYVTRVPALRMLIDFVDVDSAKWSDYAQARRWPLSWLYRREAQTLLAFERSVAHRAARAFFVTDAEVALWRRVAPDLADKASALGNGVDTEYFTPSFTSDSPFAAGSLPIVFTGAMNYWPNVDAVRWFANEVLPALRTRFPSAHFTIVGMNPSPVVTALAGDGVTVTGTVADVRPYLRHAAVVVAPLRIARGIQNKILEAMAMGCAVVASHACVAPIDAVPGRDLIAATEPAEFVAALARLLEQPAHARAVGERARARMLARHAWEAQFAPLDVALARAGRSGAAPR